MELMVMVAVIGIVTAVAVPSLLSYLRGQQLAGAQRRVASILNEARQLAISQNTTYRVDMEAGNNRIRFVRTSTNVAWVGVGTDPQGYFNLAPETPLASSSTAAITFNNLGSASAAATVTVRDSTTSSTANVCVSAAGRVYPPPRSPFTCP